MHSRRFPQDTRGIVVVHRSPEQYAHHRLPVALWDPPAYLIGRSMYETSSLPQQWAAAAAEHADEVWVPSEFNRRSFIRAGFEAAKMRVLHEPIDTRHFSPGSHQQKHLSELAPDRFKFLSVFKWEDRKGWDELLRGYLTEFVGSEDVSLLLRCSVDEQNRHQLDRSIDSIAFQAGLSRDELPQILLLPHREPADQLPGLYAAVDALVLPSHGEGWGLPIVEAMAMGLGVMTTNWLAASPTHRISGPRWIFRISELR
eukprot:TRINITY_DN23239_c0_g1_i1.p1 TRINITY_DN23239_c0_g1~~TRINITY_DN23239_c0_g1_i1.p1  ORF type:complete len:257 (+),score=39.82 TRINITY_DN23239_c0_g1_i1:589-1359(+)